MNVLDHGYVTLVETWGSDERIIEAARMSTDKGFLGWGPVECDACSRLEVSLRKFDGPVCQKCKGTFELPGDEKLLRFLYEHKHFTPFEMAGMTIEVQAPLFVFREWHRHRTQSYNEMSGRYTVLPDLYYVPSIERIMAGKQAVQNKQGSAFGLDHEEANWTQAVILSVYGKARADYERMLKAGVAKELARLVLPVAQYSKMRASANLRNWLAFLTLRAAPNAQWEIQQYAFEVARIVADKFPQTYALWVEPT